MGPTKSYFILLLFTIGLVYSCGKDPITTPGPIDPIDTTEPPVITPAKYNRDSAIKDYNEMFLATEISNVGWTGSRATCTPGTIPQSVHDAVIK
ncbi:MAG: hypothetical protein H3C54_07030, partial [Taibaiella sp.]|nr:hypothetical protein [Taibaiella sp.]